MAVSMENPISGKGAKSSREGLSDRREGAWKEQVSLTGSEKIFSVRPPSSDVICQLSGCSNLFL